MQTQQVIGGLRRFEGGPRTWQRDTLATDRWMVKLPDSVDAELHRVGERLKSEPRPYHALNPGDFDLTKSHDFITGPVKAELDHGVGIVVLDKLPIEGLSTDACRSLYWLVSRLLSRPVAQKHAGNLMMDVRDAGVPMKAGTAARGSTSKDLLEFHNDGANTPKPPKYVGLLMLHDAREGGMSRALTIETAYNWLSDNYAQALPRLYQDFKYFRMREHDPQDTAFLSAPFFQFQDGELRARVGPYQMKSAFEMGAAPMDDDTALAVEALDELFAQDDLIADFYMARGQLQLVNNRVIAHSRTEFVDHEEPERKRHLLRLWMRDEGEPTYNAF